MADAGNERFTHSLIRIYSFIHPFDWVLQVYTGEISKPGHFIFEQIGKSMDETPWREILLNEEVRESKRGKKQRSPKVKRF